MKKPSSKGSWIEAANSVGVTVNPKDTVKEIIKNIGDKLDVSSRGANFEKRVVKALMSENETAKVAPLKKKVVETGNGAMVKNKPKSKKDHKVVTFTKVISDRKDDKRVCLEINGQQMWLPKASAKLVSASTIEIPQWLADVKGI
jgi:hypothetical protein